VSDVIVGLMFSGIRVEFGVLFIWLGIGMVQYHAKSMRCFVALAVIAAVFSLLTYLVIVMNSGNATLWLFGEEVSAENFSMTLVLFFALNLLITALLLWVPVLVRKNEQHYVDKGVVFQLRNMPRAVIPSTVCIVVLSFFLGFRQYQMEQRLVYEQEQQQLIKSLNYYEIRIRSVDAETKEPLLSGTSYSNVVIPGGGIAESTRRWVSDEGWLLTSYFANPPFTVCFNISRDGYQPLVHEVIVDDDKPSRRTEVELKPQRKTDDKE
jgi:hypothetical protein